MLREQNIVSWHMWHASGLNRLQASSEAGKDTAPPIGPLRVPVTWYMVANMSRCTYHAVQENVRAVLTSSPTDVLSHVAIRARAQNVLLASCFAPEELQQMEGLEGRHISLSIDALGTVSAAETKAEASSSYSASGQTVAQYHQLLCMQMPTQKGPAPPPPPLSFKHSHSIYAKKQKVERLKKKRGFLIENMEGFIYALHTSRGSVAWMSCCKDCA